MQLRLNPRESGEFINMLLFKVGRTRVFQKQKNPNRPYLSLSLSHVLFFFLKP